MTKFRVYKSDKKEETEVFFELREQPDGSILLCVVDKAGNLCPSGCILSITNKGELFRFILIEHVPGLKRNKEDKIRLEYEED